MSDEDTDQSIFTERNTGSIRDLRDCIMGFRKLNWRRMSLLEMLLFNALLFAQNDNLREHDDRADRQLPVMSLKLIVAKAKEHSPETRSGFLSKSSCLLTRRAFPTSVKNFSHHDSVSTIN